MNATMNSVAPRPRSHASGQAAPESAGRTSEQDVALGARDGPSEPASAWQRPPRPEQMVTPQALRGALSRIASTFVALDKRENPLDLARFDDLPPEALMMAITALSVSTSMALAEMRTQAVKVRTDGAIALRREQTEALCKQLAKALEEQRAAEKGATRSRDMEFYMALGELTCGIVKFALGIHAGGAADMAAGFCGLVKVFAEDALSTCKDEDAAKILTLVAKIAGSAQSSIEGGSMAFDALSFARAFRAVRTVGTAARTALKTGGLAAELVGDFQKAETIAKQVAQTASALAPTIQAGFGAQALARYSGETLVRTFSAQAIEQMVTRAVLAGAEKAAASGATVCAEKLTDAIVRKVWWEGTKAAAKATTRAAPNFIKSATRDVLGGVNLVYKGLTAMDRAELQKEIRQLMAEGEFLQALLNEFQQAKKHAKDDISARLEDAGTAVQNAAHNIQTRSEISLRIAHGINVGA